MLNLDPKPISGAGWLAGCGWLAACHCLAGWLWLPGWLASCLAVAGSKKFEIPKVFQQKCSVAPTALFKKYCFVSSICSSFLKLL